MPNYNYYPYQPLYQPTASPVLPQAQPQPQTQPVSNGLNWVQGESAARSWLVAPGASVLLMDSEQSVFYIKSADASGMPLPLRVFEYTERKQDAIPHKAETVDYVTKAEFEEFRKEVLGEVDGVKHGKSDV